jgi:hypothetical protein
MATILSTQVCGEKTHARTKDCQAVNINKQSKLCYTIKIKQPASDRVGKSCAPSKPNIRQKMISTS